MWFVSKFYESLKEQDEEATLQDCFNENPLCEHLNDFIELNITQENYLKLIELCDFLMVSNVDILVDKIVECFGVQVIHEFGDFYKYNSQRLQLHDRESLKQAIQLYCENPEICYETYGFSAYWNVSNITNMSEMFDESHFIGDISQWDVSNVENMDKMFFYNAMFNGDISQWNVSNVKTMSGMFCDSEFNGDLSRWNVSNVTNMQSMFCESEFNGDLSRWNVSKVQNMVGMFSYSKFNGDISNWNVSNVINMSDMFVGSLFSGDISHWDVSNVTI